MVPWYYFDGSITNTSYQVYVFGLNAFCFLQVSVHVCCSCVLEADTFQTRHVRASCDMSLKLKIKSFKTINVFGRHNCLAFRITGGNCGWLYWQTYIVPNLLFVFWRLDLASNAMILIRFRPCPTSQTAPNEADCECSRCRGGTCKMSRGGRRDPCGRRHETG